MKHRIIALIEQALQSLQAAGQLDPSLQPRVQVDSTRNKLHGDLASNIALTLAKSTGRKPRDMAQLICEHLPISAEITKTEIAGPGFINFFVSEAAMQVVIGNILKSGSAYGRSNTGRGQKVQIEFVFQFNL